MTGAVAGLAALVALGAVDGEWKSVGVTSPDPSTPVERVLRVRARLLDERLSVSTPMVLMAASVACGGGAAALFAGGVSLSGGSWGAVLLAALVITLAVVASAAHVALGIVATFLLAQAIPRNASIEARVAQIDSVVGFEAPLPAPARPEALRPAHEAGGTP